MSNVHDIQLVHNIYGLTGICGVREVLLSGQHPVGSEATYYIDSQGKANNRTEMEIEMVSSNASTQKIICITEAYCLLLHLGNKSVIVLTVIPIH